MFRPSLDRTAVGRVAAAANSEDCFGLLAVSSGHLSAVLCDKIIAEEKKLTKSGKCPIEGRTI